MMIVCDCGQEIKIASDFTVSGDKIYECSLCDARYVIHKIDEKD